MREIISDILRLLGNGKKFLGENFYIVFRKIFYIFNRISTNYSPFPSPFNANPAMPLVTS